MRLTIFQKAIVLFALPLVLWISSIAYLAMLLHKTESEVVEQQRTSDFIACIDEIRKEETDTGVVAGYYFYMPTAEHWHRLEINNAACRRILTRAKQLADGNRQREATIKLLFQAHQEQEDRVLELKNRHPDLATLGLGNFNHPYMRMERAGSELLRRERKTNEDNRSALLKSRSTIQAAFIGLICFNTIFTFALIATFSRAITNRLKYVIENTRKLAKRQALHPQVKGTDEIAELDKTLHETATQLYELEQFKKELTAMVSHELRTPLTTIRGTLNILESGVWGDLPEKALRQIKIAENNSIRLLRLINELLDIEKMEAGQMEMYISSQPLQSMVSESIDAVKQFGAENHVEIDFNCPADLYAQADRDRIVQVIINLLSNAIKYSYAKSKVVLTVSDRDSDIEVRVTDQGRGIPEEFQKRIFGKFQQVDPSDKREHRGTGLGLSICKSIVELHQGEIGFESKEGSGSSFWFTLPKANQLEPNQLVSTSMM